MLLTLSYQGQALAMSSNAKFNLSVRQKPLIRKILQAKSRPAVWLTALPEAWTDLPATCRELAFPEGAQPASAPIGSLDFGAMAKAWPMRNTNRLLCADESAGSGSASTSMNAMASMDKLVDAVASTAKLAYAAAAMHQAPEPQRVLTQASVAQAQQTPLALEDLPRADVETHTVGAAIADPPATAAATSVQEKLRDLRTGMETTARKRPATASEGRKESDVPAHRRPSAAPSVLRRPASSGGGKAGRTFWRWT